MKLMEIFCGLQNELTDSMLENCKQSLPVIQGIIESTTDDESLLFEALSLHDELQQVISRYQQMEAALESGGTEPKCSGAGGQKPDASYVNKACSLSQVERQSETERTEVLKEENVESSTEIPRTVLPGKDDVEVGANKKLDSD